MDINSFVIGFAKGKKSGTGFFSTKENDAGGLTYAFKATEGGGSGGGVELNIAYGDTAPEDTTKLWVKTTQPSGVFVTNSIETVSDYKLENTGVSVSDYRANAAYCTVDDKIYIFGGNTGSGSNIKRLKTIACYNLKSKTYTTLAVTLSTALNKISVARKGSNIYLVGGATGDGSYDRSKTILCFNTESLELTTLSTTIPLRNAWFMCARHANASKAYVMDFDGSASTSKCNVLCFDAETEKVSTVASDLESLKYAGYCYDGQRYIYVAGGSVNSVTQDSVRRIDTTNGTIETTELKLFEAVKTPECAVIGNVLFVSGGTANTATGTTASLKVGFIDLKSVVTTQIPAETLLENMGVENAIYGNSYVQVGSKLYILPGYKHSNMYSTDALTGVYTFKPPVTDCEIDAGTLLIVPQIEYNTFQLINADSAKVEIGVDSVFKGNAEGKGEPVEAALYKDGAWKTL